jgi:hypothetical protein
VIDELASLDASSLRASARDFDVVESGAAMAIINNFYIRAAMEFVHDISAGLFPGAVLAAWMIRRNLELSSPAALRELEKASTGLWLVLLAAAALLVLTGAARLRYWQLNLRAGTLGAKRRSIQLKHTAFVLLLIGSVALTFTLVPG